MPMQLSAAQFKSDAFHRFEWQPDRNQPPLLDILPQGINSLPQGFDVRPLSLRLDLTRSKALRVRLAAA